MLNYFRDTPPLSYLRPIRLRQRHRPIEVSSGDRVIYRLSRRGNRHLNHAIHLAAVTQSSAPAAKAAPTTCARSPKGWVRKAPLRAKRRTSDTLNQRMIEDTRRHDTGSGKDPAGQPGNDAVSSVAGSHPDRPGLRNGHSRDKASSRTAAGNQAMLTSRPAPARRPTSRSATGVQVQPRPCPRRRCGHERH